MPRLTSNQSGKEVTVNDAVAIADSAITETYTADVTSGNATLSAAQFQQMCRLLVTNATVNGRTVTVPAKKRWFVITNDGVTGTKSIDVVRGSTSITILTGRSKFLYADGTTNGLVAMNNAIDIISGGIGTPVAAGGTLTATGNFANGETVTIGTNVYTAQTVFTAGLGHFFIGAAAIDSLTNLSRCINQSGAGGGTLYDTSVTTAHPDVTATAASPLVATARLTGSEGNAIATTETATNLSWGAVTLTGGKSKQVLAKNTDTDFDLAWVDLPRAGTVTGGGGGTTVIMPERALILPTTSTFPTAVNTTGVTATNVANGLNLSVASNGSNHNRGYVQAVPGVDFTAYARFTRGWFQRNFFSGGLWLRESATSKVTILQVGGDVSVSTLYALSNWTDPDTFSANVSRSAAEGQPNTWWFKVVYVSGSTPNYTFYESFDGVSWFKLDTQNKTTFFTTNADQIGIVINSVISAGSDTPNLTCNSWEITTP